MITTTQAYAMHAEHVRIMRRLRDAGIREENYFNHSAFVKKLNQGYNYLAYGVGSMPGNLEMVV